MKRQRLDQVLLERGFAESRQKAAAMVLAGQIIVGEHRASKPGHKIDPDADLRIKGEQSAYVSRGGYKIEAALDEFNLDPKGKICVDIGASTGGFTDCLLQRGAKKIYAVDVGYGQLAWKLREDPKVHNIERQNIRNLPREAIPDQIDLVVVDASFISLKLVLPKIWELLEPGGEVVALVKPQFEVGKGQVGKGGVVRDPELRRQAVEAVGVESENQGFAILGTMESPIVGAKKGNVEYLIHLKKTETLEGGAAVK